MILLMRTRRRVALLIARHRISKCLSTAFAAGLLALVADTATAADDARADEARDIAASCASCHGLNGDAAHVSPPLSGQSRSELLAKLKAFKSDARAGTVMPQLARGYSDAQLEQAAAWFSGRSGH
jgi:cytochrome c553